MVIIDNSEQLEQFKQSIQNSELILLPVLTDYIKHILNNKICLFYCYVLSTKQEYIILQNHPESLININIDFLRNHTKNIYCIDKKQLLHLNFKNENLIDVDLLHYLLYNKSIDLDNNILDKFYTLYNEFNDINKLIPTQKHYENCSEQCKTILNIISNEINNLSIKDFIVYNNIILKNFYEIEKNGLKINKEILNQFYPLKSRHHLNKTNFIYTDYNLFTSTGRPSNSFAGINFAALNKDDGSRKLIETRFENGILIDIDFDAYHLRLIANLIGYKFPENISAHYYLGQKYFQKQELTEQEFNDTKQVNFQVLYGGIPKEFENIEFFEKLKNYIYILYDKFNEKGYIESTLFKRKIYKENISDINMYKLWNYFIQLYETENNSILIYKLQKLLSNKQYQSKLILYTYDSFLFDVDLNDGKQIIKEIKEILQYPVKMKYGLNYQDLK